MQKVQDDILRDITLYNTIIQIKDFLCLKLDQFSLVNFLFEFIGIYSSF